MGAGTHGLYTCRLCAKEFKNRSLLAKHKILKHGYTPEKLGWLVGGWNKGKLCPNFRGNKNPIGKFTSEHRNSKSFKEKYDFARKRHKEEILKKFNKLKNKGYKAWITSIDSRPIKIPDIVAVSSDGKEIIAIEMESIRSYKASIDTYRKRYTKKLLSIGFFNEVIVEGFISDKNRKVIK